MQILIKPADYADMLLRRARYETLVAVEAALKSRDQHTGMCPRYLAEVIHLITKA